MGTADVPPSLADWWPLIGNAVEVTVPQKGRKPLVIRGDLKGIAPTGAFVVVTTENGKRHVPMPDGATMRSTRWAS